MDDQAWNLVYLSAHGAILYARGRPKRILVLNTTIDASINTRSKEFRIEIVRRGDGYELRLLPDEADAMLLHCITGCLWTELHNGTC